MSQGLIADDYASLRSTLDAVEDELAIRVAVSETPLAGSPEEVEQFLA